jgi:hypothetical protein
MKHTTTNTNRSDDGSSTEAHAHIRVLSSIAHVLFKKRWHNDSSASVQCAYLEYLVPVGSPVPHVNVLEFIWSALLMRAHVFDHTLAAHGWIHHALCTIYTVIIVRVRNKIWMQWIWCAPYRSSARKTGFTLPITLLLMLGGRKSGWVSCDKYHKQVIFQAGYSLQGYSMSRACRTCLVFPTPVTKIFISQ